MSIARTLKSIFSWLWAGADGVRKVLHLLLLLIVFGIFFSALSGQIPSLPSKAALVIRPVGSIVEQLEGDAFDRALAEITGDGNPQTLLGDILDGLRYAKEDDRIDAVVLDLGSIGGAGLSKLEQIGDAIDDFQLSGKPVLATADYYSQGAYYLASRADEVYMHRDGFMLLNGFGVYRNYYKNAIDKLQIDWNVFKVGTHKAYVEPYTRDDMSDENRESMRSLLDQLWASYTSDVQQARQLDDGTIEGLTGDFLERVAAAQGRIGEVYLSAGLFDGLLTRAEFQEKVLQHVAEDPDKAGYYRHADLDDYLTERRMFEGTATRKSNIAVIVAVGTIMNGSQPPGTIGGDSTAALLRKARLDDTVKAVVLRVDSGGGSMFASQVIGDEVLQLKNAGKPVVASMGSVAASGGYWISMAADKIYATSSTITGSIGVFNMFPTFQRTMNTLGVTTDGIGSTVWSGEFRADREMSAHTRSLMQVLVNEAYDNFITQVAEYRGLDKAQVDLIAQGQVWTGTDALANGLIDELGTLDDAIKAAAILADLEDDQYGLKYFEKELSMTEQFVADLMGSTRVREIVGSARVKHASPVDQLVTALEQVLAPIALFNDPQGNYAYCFCVFE